jgi:hypothetical protein
MSEKKVEMWLPTNVMKATVVDGEVKVWDEMTFEKRPIKQPPGFVQKPAAPPDDPSHRSP